MSARNNKLITTNSSSESRSTLFCLHHAGGGGAGFRRWSRMISPDIQVASVVLPGREGLSHVPPFTDFTIAVQRIAEEMQTFTQRPYALFGHSLGAVLAFETACLLERNGLPGPCCVIVSGRRAPHLRDDPGETDAKPSSELPEAEFIELLENMGGMPKEILNNPEMLEFLLPVIRADFRLAENYSWDGCSKCACPLMVFGGTEDTYASFDELHAWARHSVAKTSVLRFQGGHFFISSQEAEVCRAISGYLYQHL